MFFLDVVTQLQNCTVSQPQHSSLCILNTCVNKTVILISKSLSVRGDVYADCGLMVYNTVHTYR